ncbi:MAG TPA: hypothetical protein VFH43_03060 [Candidatus Kapabacteria bacterium]|nr:hypothetical protein [Candidatus Kapabacteria bacterium]
MRWIGYVTLMICALCLAGEADAQTKKNSEKSSKKSKTSQKQVDKKAASGISIAKGGKMVRPTSNLDPGSVGYYFYPMTPGSYWKTRTVKSLYDLQDSLIASDTLFHKETVSTNSAPSIQGLPLIKCFSKSFRHGQHEDSAQAQEVAYYVDDSLIMAVFNNSITHSENVSLLTTPLREGYIWPERFEDTIGTKVISLHESVVTPAGKFENAVLTSTRLGFGELSKYFVGGKGIVKMIFRGFANGGMGKIIVTTDLMEIHHELSHMEGSPTDAEPARLDPTMAK